ncbi:sulfotransferase 1C4 [Hyalella azteca]|uniref:Sulfotransferase 1C4 n=1 Tax=Hyalella azteca TaxID=294128 RepID=A0A979FU39_HYAAZ|nr:sulfotransferase 1C4 [Hyalella azteca]XP_047740730.1 sulfotransferase 1C4 [Hyalella azteca]XP_047740731.1 sulfotransferase 1C4 [Hyalella azteca]XP_047740732.1 sulfotransferase 1C4 [Hyalella azteca]
MSDELDRLELSGGRYALALSAAQQKKYVEDFTGTRNKMFRIHPCGTIVCEGFKYIEKDVYNFTFRPDDVLVMSYLKCGTTWTQEIIWNMIYSPNQEHADTDEPLITRSPVIEADMFMMDALKKVPIDHFLKDPMFSHYRTRCPNPNPNRGLHLQLAESYTERRVLKTHLPFSCYQPGLLDKCKVIVCVRHPKDVMLSYQHHCRLIKTHGFKGTQDTFIKYFVEDLLAWGSYAHLLREALEFKSHPNIHFIYYEDMKADIDTELLKLNEFLGLKLNSEQLNNVQQQTCFDSMQKLDPYRLMVSEVTDKQVAEKDGPFIRQGKAGGWKGKLTAEQEEILDDYISKNFADLDLKVRYL